MKSLLQNHCWMITLVLMTAVSNLEAQSLDSLDPHQRRQFYLDQILQWLPSERPNYGRVSYLDSTFSDWLDRTGELPPDFSKLPDIYDLPDPLLMNEGQAEEPVRTMDQWTAKKAWMRDQLKHYITGTFPPAPENIMFSIISERMDGPVKIQMVELRFGPDHKAKLTMELMIPPGEGPFPVFMTQWNHRGWAQIAVRRGYIGCVYAGADSKDDTEDYSRIWAGEYDFTRLMRRAWGSFRAIDYLYTLPNVDREKIALTGHSRNGKQALMAAAFDDRITAVVPSSGGTGAEVPWRYCAYKYDVEDIALLGPAQPSWLHPRLRFFVGREYKMPVDQNSFMALVAPRGLMLSTATEEVASNPWGIEKAFGSAKKVYEFLSAKDQIAIRYRSGTHGTTAEDIEAYIDFFDYSFGRSSREVKQKYTYVSSFEEWKKQSGEDVQVKDFPVHHSFTSPGSDEDQNISNDREWKAQKRQILEQVQWMLGEKPAGVANPSPKQVGQRVRGEEKFGSVIRRPEPTETMGRQAISPYNGFGDYLFGYLYYPRAKLEKKENMPVVIYLHEYDYSKGFSSMGLNHNIDDYFESLVQQGYAVFAFDMIGFGTRQKEGLHFYDRYPRWSKMGKMVADVQGAVDALLTMDVIDPKQIFVAGYSLGGTVGLYATALDERIAGVASVSGFTPMRTGQKNKWHIQELCDEQMLVPRLGFFQDETTRIPYDYDDLLAAIAPRPVLVIAPEYDQDAEVEGVSECVRTSNELFQWPGAERHIDLYTPADYNRFSEKMREKVYEWLKGRKGRF